MKKIIVLIVLHIFISSNCFSDVESNSTDKIQDFNLSGYELKKLRQTHIIRHEDNIGIPTTINPYLSFIFAKNFKTKFHYSGEYRLFVPLVQNLNQILFCDLRLYETNRLEFNGHLGFRKGKNLDNLWGIYVGFDYRQGNLNDYQQLMCGGEIWYRNWFFGGNYYQPFFKNEERVYFNKKKSETVLSGGDLVLGREFNSRWSLWLTNYYFGKNGSNLVGGRGKIEYRLTNIRCPMIFFGETQKDQRGWQFSLGMQLKIGNFADHRSNHGYELIKRDPDIVIISKDNIIFDNINTNNNEQKDFKDWEHWSGDYIELSEEDIQEYRKFLLREMGITEISQINTKKREILLTCHPDKTTDLKKQNFFTRFMNLYNLYQDLDRFCSKKFDSNPVKNIKLISSDSKIAKNSKSDCVIQQKKYVDNVGTKSLVKNCECLVVYPEIIPKFADIYYSQQKQPKSLWLWRRFAQYHVFRNNTFLPTVEWISIDKFNNYLFLINKLPISFVNRDVENFLLKYFLVVDENSKLIIRKIFKNLKKEQELIPLKNWEKWWEKESKDTFLLQKKDLDYFFLFYRKILTSRHLSNYERLRDKIIYPEYKPSWLKEFLDEIQRMSIVFAGQNILFFTAEEERKRHAFFRKHNLEWLEGYFKLLPVTTKQELDLLLDFLITFNISFETWSNYFSPEINSLQTFQYYLLFKQVFPKLSLGKILEKELEKFLDNELPWDIKLSFLIKIFPNLHKALDFIAYLNQYQNCLILWQLEDHTGKSLKFMLNNPIDLSVEDLQVWLTAVDQGDFLNSEQFWEQFINLNSENEEVIFAGKKAYEVVEKAYKLYPTVRLKNFNEFFSTNRLNNAILAEWQIPEDLNSCLFNYSGEKYYDNCLKEQYRNNDYYLWFDGVDQKTSLLERLIVIMEAGKIQFGYLPRFAQLFSAVLPLYFDKGSLLQVGTGEGKSYIVALHAILRSTYKEKVDISTTISILSERDAKIYAPFYAMFSCNVGELGWKMWQKIKVDNNQNQENQNLYHSDILYGDIESYISDDLQDTHYHDLRKSRQFDGTHIVDEVDYLFLDRNDHAVMIGNKFPGHDSFRLLFIDIWHFTNQILNALEFEDDSCVLKVKSLDNLELNKEGAIFHILVKLSKIFKERSQVPIEECEIWLDQIITDRLLQQGKIILPEHLHHFLNERKEMLIDNLFNSFSLHPLKDFVLERRNGFTSLEPIEISTGVEMEKVHLIDGLHSFLALSQNILLPEETVVSLEETYPYFYKKYSKLVGFSGTLGKSNDLMLLRKIYGVNPVIIPSFIVKSVAFLSVIWAENEEDWYFKIAKETNFYFKMHRTVIVIMETIKEVMNLKDILSKSFSKITEPILYIDSKNNSNDLDRELTGKDIIITTNLGGRGTDFKIDYLSILRGGGHLIKTKISSNQRIDDQAIGRVGRQGQPGSYQFILNLEKEFHSDCPVFNDIYYDAKIAENLYHCLLDVRERLAQVNYAAELEKFNWLQKKQHLKELKTEEERNWLMPFLPDIIFGKKGRDFFEIGIIVENNKLFACVNNRRIDLTSDILKFREETLDNLIKKVHNPSYLLNFYDDQLLRFLLIKYGFSKVVDLNLYGILEDEVKKQVGDKLVRELETYSIKQEKKYREVLLLKILFKEVSSYVDHKFIEKISLKIRDKKQQVDAKEIMWLHLIFQTWLEKNQLSLKSLIEKQLNESWSIFVSSLKFEFSPEEIIQKWIIQKQSILQNNRFFNNAIYYHQLVEYFQNTYDSVVEELNRYYWVLISSVPYQQRLIWCEEQSLLQENTHYLVWIRKLLVAQNRLNLAQKEIVKDTKANRKIVIEAKQEFVKNLEEVLNGINYHLDFHKIALLELPSDNQEEIIFQLSYISRLDQIYQACFDDLMLVKDSSQREKIILDTGSNFILGSLNLTATIKSLKLNYSDTNERPEITEICNQQLINNGFQKHNLIKIKLKPVKLIKRWGALGIGFLEIILGGAVFPFSSSVGSLLILNGLDVSVRVLDTIISDEDFNFKGVVINGLINVALNYGKSLCVSMLGKDSSSSDEVSDAQNKEHVFREAMWNAIKIKIKNLVTNTVLDRLNQKIILQKDHIADDVNEVINRLLKENKEILERILMTDFVNKNHLAKQNFEQMSLMMIKNLAENYYADNYRMLIDKRDAKNRLKELIDKVDKGLNCKNYVLNEYRGALQKLGKELPTYRQLFEEFLRKNYPSKFTEIGFDVKTEEDCVRLGELKDIGLEFITKIKEQQMHSKILENWLQNLGVQFVLSFQQNLNNDLKKLEIVSADLLIDTFKKYHIDNSVEKNENNNKLICEKNLVQRSNHVPIDKYKIIKSTPKRSLVSKTSKVALTKNMRKPKVSSLSLMNHAWIYDEIFGDNKLPEQMGLHISDYNEYLFKDLLRTGQNRYLSNEWQWQKFDYLLSPQFTVIDDKPFFEKVGDQVQYVGNIKSPKEIADFLNAPLNKYFRVKNVEDLVAKMPPNSLVLGERPLRGCKFLVKNPDVLSKYATSFNHNWRVVHRHVFYTDSKGQLHNLGFTSGKDPIFQEDLELISEYRFSPVATNINNLETFISDSVEYIRNKPRHSRYRFLLNNCQHFSEKIITVTLISNSTSS